MFDATAFQTLLRQYVSPRRAPKFTLIVHECIPSTNQVLWDCLTQGLTPPLVVIAQQQSAGRGQWGRQWDSAPGGLYLSWAIAVDLPVEHGAQLTLWSAWGIARSLRQQSIPVDIKWPNDLILQGRKLGGIKIETKTQLNRITQAVIGVGINWSNPVPDVGINLQSYGTALEHSSLNSLEALAACTLAGLFLGGDRYQHEGIASMLRDYIDLLHNRGQTITVKGTPGIVTGVTADGLLIVRLQAAGTSSNIHLTPGSIRLGYDS